MKAKLVAIAIGVFILLVTLFSSLFSIDAGHVGVMKRFGAVTGEIFHPGLNVKIPFVDTSSVIDVRISSIDAIVNAGSRDQQDVKAVVSVQYFLAPSFTPKLVDGLGDRAMLEAAILESAVQESVKAVTAQYTAEELLTKRPEVKVGINTAIESYIAVSLAEKDLDGLVKVANIGVKDINFSEEFNKAIEAKVKTQQQAQQAIAAKQKRITDAEAANEEKKLQADAEAYRVLKEAESRAAAINAEGAALQANPQVIDLRLAEKWNGVLPVANGGGILPFLNLEKFITTTPAQ